MAFRQPIVAPRRLDARPESEYKPHPVNVTTQRTPVDESREWVLFPPSQAYSSQTRTTFTARTPQTTGRSRISDFGSIGITVRSGENERGSTRNAHDAVGEEEDLDSLDEGLHAFHDPALDRFTRVLDRSGAILPTHDGWGTFPLSSAQIQEQLWQFERHNPRKWMPGTRLGGSSLRRHVDATLDTDGVGLDNERRERIEKWRIDQSRLLLDEIEKHSRKRSWSQSVGRNEPCAPAHGAKRSGEGLVDVSLHQQLESLVGEKEQQIADADESVWGSITRRLYDLLGINEVLLSILCGDALPPDEYPPSLTSSTPELASCPPSKRSLAPLLPEWHSGLLDRLSRELGFLVQHLSEHPGAFSTHVQLPGPDLLELPAPSPSLFQVQPERSSSRHDMDSSSSVFPTFKPTLQGLPVQGSTSRSETTNAALWGIEEEAPPWPIMSAGEEREYWERAPDVKSVFRLLHTRFASPKQTPPPNPNLTTTSTLATLRRASIICQHHPLVPKVPMRRTRNALLNHHHRQHFSWRRTGSSCASLSVRKGKRGSGSSRNYWDLGGSGVGGGSARAATVGFGFWGEV
jgi:hypothetical protein